MKMKLINLLFLTSYFIGLAVLADENIICEQKSGCFDQLMYCDCLRARRSFESKILNGTNVKIVFSIR